MPEEWDAMKSALNEWVKIKDGDDELKKWRRRWIYNWISFMYHFGGRPHEAMALRIGDLETQLDMLLSGKEDTDATEQARRETASSLFTMSSIPTSGSSASGKVRSCCNASVERMAPSTTVAHCMQRDCGQVVPILCAGVGSNK